MSGTLKKTPKNLVLKDHELATSQIFEKGWTEKNAPKNLVLNDEEQEKICYISQDYNEDMRLMDLIFADFCSLPLCQILNGHQL